MNIDKELLKSAFEAIEEERKEEFDATLEKLMGDALTRKEEQKLKRRLRANKAERDELLEMIRVGVFRDSPFEDGAFYQEILAEFGETIPSTRRVLEKKTRRAIPWLVAAASILALCVVGVERAQRNERAQELRLARAELTTALKEEGFELPTNENALLHYGYDLNGKAFDAKSLSNLPEVVANDATRRVDRAFDVTLERVKSDEILLDRASFILREERDVRRAKDVLTATRSESPRKDALLGVVEFMEGEPEKALNYFRRAREKDDRLDYALNEAVCLIVLGKFEDAKPILTRVMEQTDDERIRRDIQETIDERGNVAY